MDMSISVKPSAKICRRLLRLELRTGQTRWKLKEPSVKKTALSDLKMRR